jgi:hypothetical protein
MAYTYSAFLEVKTSAGRHINFSASPTITVLNGTTEAVIASPAPVLVNLATGIYKVKVTIDDLVDVVFKVVVAAGDQATLHDTAALQGKIEQTVDERIDAAMTSRLSSAAYTAPDNAGILAAIGGIVDGVWTRTVREITGGGGSAADVWAWLTTSTMPDGSIGKMLSDLLAVFNSNSRTLTMTPKQIVAALEGDGLVVHRGDTFEWTFTGLPGLQNRESLYLTAKSNKKRQDSGAIIQVSESDGMLVLNGQDIEGTDEENASLEVMDEVEGVVKLTISEVATQTLPILQNGYYDIQVGGVKVITIREGSWTVESDVTRRIT